MNLRHILLFAVLVLSLFSLFGSCSIEPEQYEIEATRREPSNCTLSDGIKIEHGVQFVGYKDSAVPSGQTCSSKIQTCKDGKISGDYLYSSCNVAASNACIFNGKIVESGDSVIAYSNDTIDYSGQCSTIAEPRLCTDGTLSGSFTHSTCTPKSPNDCYLDGVVLNGESIIAYDNNSVPYSSVCSSISEARTCSNGTLSGSYTHTTCAPQDPLNCTFHGETVSHGNSVVAYLYKTVESVDQCSGFSNENDEARVCNNGTLSGSFPFATCNVKSSVCSDNGTDNITTSVGVFSYPGLNGGGVGDLSDENANLASIIQKLINDGEDYTLDTSITSFTDPDLETKLANVGFFFMTDMENQDPSNTSFFPVTARSILNNYVNLGGVIMMTGTYGSRDVDFLNLIFDWDLVSVIPAGAASRNDANAAGTPFADVASTSLPPSLSATEFISKGSVDNFTTMYGTDSQAAIAVIRHGSGYVIYLGYDYFNTGYAVDLNGTTHANGAENSHPWVTEMIPAGLKYSTGLASGCY